MNKLAQIYEGKAKILFSTEEPTQLMQYFKDDATAFNGQKKSSLVGKGILNNLISEFIMKKLAESNIPTHFIKRINDREQLINKVDIIPLEVIIRNIVAGSLAKKLNIAEGTALLAPIFEICYKNDSLQDPLINDDHAIEVLKVVNKNQLDLLKDNAFKINQILKNIFNNIEINLVDFKIEFGFDSDGEIILADEISPDGCRLWDKNTAEKLDKDRFRRDLGGLVDAYREIANRLKLKI
mgnify:CR=1 FL=1